MRPGDTIRERFRLDAPAGSGGMGTVWRAFDLIEGAPVALKVLRAEFPVAEERFVREATLLARVRHPGIVRYVAHGVEPGGTPWLAMEWLEGVDLAGHLARHLPTIQQSVDLVERVADALAQVHALGVVHRDVKPQNIFLEGGDPSRPKLLDLGIARATAGRSTLTRTGAVIGTVGYMSPEQAAGDGDIDARADVFSLGCVLWECLTGAAVFPGENALAVLAKVILEPPRRLRELLPAAPAALEDVLARMLDKDRDGRPADGAAVAAALATLGPLGEIDDHSGPRAAEPRAPSSLGDSEQRVLSIVLAAAARRGGNAGDAAAGAAGAADEIARAYGARSHRLADGSVLLALAGSGAATDQAARAARCALALRAALAGAPIVLATGRAVVPAAGSGTGGALVPLGAVIDRAAGLVTAAPREGVRLDAETAALLDARFDVAGDADGAVLRGERGDAEAPRTLLGRPSRLWGRAPELAELEALWNECRSEPVARAVLLTAPAGGGKSRLRWELLHRLRERGEPFELLQAHGDALRSGSPFGLVAEAIRRAAGVRAQEPAGRTKLAAHLARRLPADAVERVGLFLGEIAGAGEVFAEPGAPTQPVAPPTLAATPHALRLLEAARGDPAQMLDAIRTAFQDWLDAECAAAPVLFVVEDLHWGDRSSVDLIDGALRRLRRRPFMVLGLARPELADRYPDLWAEREVQPIALAALPRSAAERMARDALGAGPPDALVARLVEQSGGNPFYLEELVRAVAQPAAGAAAAGAESVPLPDTVLGMVQARLDTLGAEGRRVLRAASVFGRLFWRGGVAALVGAGAGARAADTAGLDDWLDELVGREIVARRPAGRFASDLEYAFRHDLVREAAYAMLTEEDRLLGHRLAAAWLEAHAEPDALTLAEHWERGGDGQRAAQWLLKSARDALEHGDSAGGAERGERGLAAGPAPAVRGPLRLVLAEAYRYAGRRVESREQGRLAADELPAGTEPWYRALCFLLMGARPGEDEWARAQARRMVAAPHAAAARGIRLRCISIVAGHLTLQGMVEAGDEIAAAAEEAARDPAAAAGVGVAFMHTMRAVRAIFAGDPAGWTLGHEESRRLYDAAGFARQAAIARANAGQGWLQLGCAEEAARTLAGALEDLERWNMPRMTAATMADLAAALRQLGRLAEARAALERPLHVFTAAGEAGDARNFGGVRAEHARLLEAGGDVAAALEEARVAVAALRPWPSACAVALAVESRLLRARGDRAAALERAREAFALLRAGGPAESGESEVWLAWIEAQRSAGDSAGASATLAAARERLFARAARIGDEKLRERFLRHDPDNAALLRAG